MTLGNLAHRTLSLIQRNCEGRAAGGLRRHRGRCRAAGGPRGCRPASRRISRRRSSTWRWRPSWPRRRAANGYIDRAGALGAEEDRPGAHGGGAAAPACRRCGSSPRYCSPSCRGRRRRCWTSWRARSRRGASPTWRPRCRRVRRCRRRRRCSARSRSRTRPPEPPYEARSEAEAAPPEGLAMLVDSHCHLDTFSEDGNRGHRRQGPHAGVGRMVTIGTRVAQAATVKALADRFPDVWGTVGVHPHNAGEEVGMPTVEAIVGPGRPPAHHRHRRMRAGLLLRQGPAGGAAGRLPPAYPRRPAYRPAAASMPAPRMTMSLAILREETEAGGALRLPAALLFLRRRAGRGALAMGGYCPSPAS